MIRIFVNSWRNRIVCKGNKFSSCERTCVVRLMIRMSWRGARLPSEQVDAAYGLSIPTLPLFLQEWSQKRGALSTGPLTLPRKHLYTARGVAGRGYMVAPQVAKCCEALERPLLTAL